MTKLSTILDQIDSGAVLLPEFQRGYVWNRDQVRGLMLSLYRAHPVGALLMWETSAKEISVRGESSSHGVHHLLLDGQQRITSLYGVIRGKAPAFFEGDPATFTGLYFNVEREVFEFYMPSKMADDPCWVNVTDLFRNGPVPFLNQFSNTPDKANLYLDRLARLWQVSERDFHQEKITGENKDVGEVVDIFNRVNSGGTKLSKGDLALAKVCAQWSDARTAMREHLDHWENLGFKFTLDWLLRNVNAVATSRALFTALDSVSAETFQRSLTNSAAYIGRMLDHVSGRLGLDHNRVLMARYAIPVLSLLLDLEGGQFRDSAQRDKALYWYVHASLWGRFAGSTETYLQQDLDAVKKSGVDGLITLLERWHGGNLDVQPHDFDGSTKGSRFYPLLYMLTRVNGARDFGSGLELKAEMLGKLTSLQVHHIFPKSQLYKAGYERHEVNAVANFCFLTQQTNLEIGDRAPEEYFAEYEAKHPGVLTSQWIPTDPQLWRIDRYRDFLEARRELLAQAAQSFLSSLRTGQTQQGSELERLSHVSGEDEDPRAVQIRDAIDELLRMGCAQPQTDTEIADPRTGRQLAMAEALWVDGLQTGQGASVVLELDPDSSDLPRMAELGYEVFTSVDALLGYAHRRNEAAAGETDEDTAPEAGVHEPAAAASAVEEEFAAGMKAIYERGRSEANYSATYFLSMLADIGPQETAHKLLRAPAVSDGFAALWERGRLDLTVEALVTEPRFAELFDEEELATAHHRLRQFGYAAA